MMQKYMGSSIENKKVVGDCGKSESVQKFLIIYLKRADSKTLMCQSAKFFLKWKLLMNEFSGTPFILFSKNLACVL